jgi:hypothetical protein
MHSCLFLNYKWYNRFFNQVQNQNNQIPRLRRALCKVSM